MCRPSKLAILRRFRRGDGDRYTGSCGAAGALLCQMRQRRITLEQIHTDCRLRTRLRACIRCTNNSSTTLVLTCLIRRLGAGKWCMQVSTQAMSRFRRTALDRFVFLSNLFMLGRSEKVHRQTYRSSSVDRRRIYVKHDELWGDFVALTNPW